MENDVKVELVINSKEYFKAVVDTAVYERKIQASLQAKTYVVDLLQYFLSTEHLYDLDIQENKSKPSTLAELFLTAQNASGEQKSNLLKKLGDKSLYISGFFSDSLNRKIVDTSYYIQMGETAFNTLAAHTKEDLRARVYEEIARKFVSFVDVLTYISMKSQIQTNRNLLQVYDAYLKTGSEMARQTLIESGIVTISTTKAKGSRQ